MVEFPIPSNCFSIFNFSSALMTAVSWFVFSVGSNDVEWKDDQYKIR